MGEPCPFFVLKHARTLSSPTSFLPGADLEEGDELPEVQGNLSFKDVKFTYPSRSQAPILKVRDG